MRHCLSAFALSLLIFMHSFGAFASQADSSPTKSDTESPQLLLRQMPKTHPERIILSYYKTADINPDFARWAALSPFLDNALSGDVPIIVQRERNRLERLSSLFDKDELLSVHTQINLQNYSTLREKLVLESFNPKTFFTFSLYDENIALVPKDIAQFNEIDISTTRMNEILQETKGGSFIAELLLKPIHADTQTPFMYHDKPYKLMLADIAEIRFWTRDAEAPKLLWTYRADWYNPRASRALMDLKANEDSQ